MNKSNKITTFRMLLVILKNASIGEVQMILHILIATELSYSLKVNSNFICMCFLMTGNIHYQFQISCGYLW